FQAKDGIRSATVTGVQTCALPIYWLCCIYVAYRRRLRGSRDTYGELAAKTRQLIEENTTFIKIAEALPVFKIDENYTARLDDLQIGRASCRERVEHSVAAVSITYK